METSGLPLRDSPKGREAAVAVAQEGGEAIQVGHPWMQRVTADRLLRDGDLPRHHRSKDTLQDPYPKKKKGQKRMKSRS